MIKAIYELDMTPRRTLPIIINVSQYDDIGRTLVFNLFSSSGKWTAPTSAAVTFEGGKPDGKFFAYNCAYSNGTVTVTIQQQMTAVAGKVRCKVKVKSGDKVVESAPVIMVVDAAAVPDGSDMSKSDINDAIANATQKIVDQVKDNIPLDYSQLSTDVSSLKQDKVDKPSAADDGKIPRAKEGGVEWVEVGQPTDEQTNSAVSSWLNEHPEVTTTVMDGSINEEKFANTLRKKKANYYILVEKMKEDTSLIIDTVCVTLGYYKLNDGGESTYKIRKKIATDIDDGGSIIFLNNGFVAELIVENETVNVKQFGAHGDNITDDYNSFINAINFSKENGFKIKIPVGTFIISKQLNLKSVVGLRIIGSGDSSERYATKIIYRGTNSFLNLNGCKNVYISNFHLEANNGTGISLTGDRSVNCHFSDIYISNMIYGVYITATTGYTYFDRVRMNVSNNTVNGIFIDCDNEIYTNYIYFRECAVDALSITDKTRTLVYLGNCYYIYFSHCDICNGHIGISFDKNVDYVFINDTTLYNMDVGLLTLKSVAHIPYIYATNTLLKCKTGLNEETGLGSCYGFSSCSWNCTVHNIDTIKRPAKAYSCHFTKRLENLKDKIFETCEAMNNKYYLPVNANSTESKEILIIGDSMTKNYVAISPDNELVINSQSYDYNTKKIKLSVTNKTNYDRGAFFLVY